MSGDEPDPPGPSEAARRMREWIGREAVYEAPEELGAAAIRYFALALQDDNPIYSDDDFARTTRHGGVIAPPTLVCETCQFYRGEPDESGYLGHAWDFPLEDARFVRGGNEYEFFRPVRPDDRITVTWRVVDVEEKAMRRGGRRIFVVSEARYRDRTGALVAVNRETAIYKP